MRLSRLVLAVGLFLAMSAAAAPVFGVPALGDMPSTATPDPGHSSGTLTHGVPRTVNFPSAGSSTTLSFYGTSGRRLLVEQTNRAVVAPQGDYRARFRFSRPDGTSYGLVTSSTSLQSLVLDASGRWTVVITLAPASTGSLDVTVVVPQGVDGGTLVPGQTVTTQTRRRGAEIVYSFRGQAGQRPTVFVTAQSFIEQDGADQGEPAAAQVLFYRPDGTQRSSDPVPEVGRGDDFAQSYAEGQKLDATGLWHLVIVPAPDSFGSQTLTFDLVRDPAPTPVDAGAPVRVTIPRMGVNISHTVSARSDQQVLLKVSDYALTEADGLGGGTSPSFTFRLLDPDGNEVGPLDRQYSPVTKVSYVDYSPLADSGTYTYVVDGSEGTTGAVTVQLTPFTKVLQSSTTIGSPSDVTISVPTQLADVSFAGAQGQQLSVTISNPSWVNEQAPGCPRNLCSVDVTLRGRGNTAVDLGDASKAGELPVPQPLPANGTYTLLLHPYGVTTGSATFTVHLVGG